jgi:hypothetical protein
MNLTAYYKTLLRDVLLLNSINKEITALIESKIFELGYVVSKYTSDIYRIDGVTIGDDNLCTKTVTIESFTSKKSDMKLREEKVYLETFDSGVKYLVKFWRPNYEYFIIKFKHLHILGLPYNSVKKLVSKNKFKDTDTIIVGKSIYDERFVLAHLVLSVSVGNKFIVKPKLPAIRAFCKGIDLYIFYAYNKFEVRPFSLDLSNSALIHDTSLKDSVKNSIAGFYINTYGDWDSKSYSGIFLYKRGFRVELPSLLEQENVFERYEGYYFITNKSIIGDTLLIPKDCLHLTIEQKADLSNLVSLVFNKNLQGVNTNLAFFERTPIIKELYFSKDCSVKEIAQVLDGLLSTKYTTIGIKSDLIAFGSGKMTKKDVFLDFENLVAIAFNRKVKIKLY